MKALGYIDRAAESYARVVDLTPLHLDARISLSTLQQQLGRPEKALEALEPMYDPDTLAQDANAAQQVKAFLLWREPYSETWDGRAKWLQEWTEMLDDRMLGREQLPFSKLGDPDRKQLKFLLC